MNDFFNVLSDDTRLRCLMLLCAHQELCVCELEFALNLSQSKISRHLLLLKLNGLIQKRRCGQWMLYSMYADLSQFKTDIIQLITAQAKEKALFKSDSARLSTMQCRPKTKVSNV